MDNKPRINKAAVYNTIADAMPMEGRDFRLDTGVDAGGKPILVFTAISAIGRAFAPIITERLNSSVQKDGMSVVSGGVEQQEAVTVKSIRARVDAEAAEALKRKVEEAEALMKAKAAEAAEAAKNNVQAEISRTRMAYNSAMREAEKARKVAAKVAEVRKEIDEAALSAANAELASGKSWAVDMNAPLSTLFDRQDVEETMRNANSLAMGLAAKEVEADDIRRDAVSVMKRYILPKGE